MFSDFLTTTLPVAQMHFLESVDVCFDVLQHVRGLRGSNFICRSQFWWFLVTSDLVIATKSVLQKRVLGIEITQNFLGGSAPGPPASPTHLHQLPLLGRTCCRVQGGVPAQGG